MDFSISFAATGIHSSSPLVHVEEQSSTCLKKCTVCGENTSNSSSTYLQAAAGTLWRCRIYPFGSLRTRFLPPLFFPVFLRFWVVWGEFASVTVRKSANLYVSSSSCSPLGSPASRAVGSSPSAFGSGFSVSGGVFCRALGADLLVFNSVRIHSNSLFSERDSSVSWRARKGIPLVVYRCSISRRLPVLLEFLSSRRFGARVRSPGAVCRSLLPSCGTAALPEEAPVRGTHRLFFGEAPIFSPLRSM